MILLVPPRPAAGQGTDDHALVAYEALLVTPTGSFAPRIGATLAADTTREPYFTVRYAHLLPNSPSGSNAFGLTVDWAVLPRIDFSATGGRFHPGCDCPSHSMGSVGTTVSLVSLQSSDARRTMRSGLRVDAGIASDPDVTFYSLALSTPLVLHLRTSAASIAPYVAPGVGRGWAYTGPYTENGYRAFVGGGLAVDLARYPLRVAVGAQHIVIEGERTAYGVNITLIP